MLNSSNRDREEKENLRDLKKAREQVFLSHKQMRHGLAVLRREERGVRSEYIKEGEE